MTEETDIERLDYSKAPPGYEALRLDGEVMYRREGCRLLPLDGPYGAWAFCLLRETQRPARHAYAPVGDRRLGRVLQPRA